MTKPYILACATTRVRNVMHHGSQVDMLIALLSKGALANLQTLNLNQGQIGDAGVTNLADVCARGALVNLSFLLLWNNRIGDAGVIALSKVCTNGALVNLKKLLLSDNRIGDAGVTALANAIKPTVENSKRALANLKTLRLIDSRIGDAGATALADAFAKGALPRLTSLYVDNPYVDNLQRHPRLAQVCRDRGIQLS